MSKNLESEYVKKQDFGGISYTIFDIKQAAMDCNFKFKKLPYSLRVLFKNVVRNGGAKESLMDFKEWLKEKIN